VSAICFERLEGRIVLSAPVVGADGGATFARPAALGKLGGSLVVQNSLSRDESSDFFSFSLRSEGNVNLTLDGLSANANLRLFDSVGHQLAISNRTRTRGDWISTTLGRGSYAVSVDRGKHAADTDYTLALQADLNYQTVTIDGTAYDIGLRRADGTTAAIAPDRETWVVIHGWLSGPAAVHRVASAIQAASPRVQVLELDWSEAAADPNTVAVALRVPDVAAFAAAKLNAWGISGSLINLVGHSFGGYMTDEIARRIKGGVDRLVALDPAAPVVAGVDISGTNYAAHSRHAIAFVGSNYAQLKVAGTADEMITLDVGKWSRFATHSNVRELFATMLEQDNGRHPDAISRLFALSAIDSPNVRGFRNNAMGNGAEAMIVGQQSGGVWYPATLTYKNSRGKTTVVTA
jgi:pimeloyl-ACP methyl ester carboxylesterase